MFCVNLTVGTASPLWEMAECFDPGGRLPSSQMQRRCHCNDQKGEQ
jgi:hypothetical protein